MSKYQDTLDYMFAQLPMYHRIGAAAFKKDLTNTVSLCAACGDPHLTLKTIHIAGTNGKGTVSHIIAGCLQAQGYKVGVYTSPHYKDFRERIKINGVFIPKSYITTFVARYKTELEDIKPSFFEMTVAMAFSYFRDAGVDYAVIETGLGGRLDSTNVITPLLSVITNISMDHQSMLGDTLSAIAGEKAGIIKPNIPCVIGETQSEIANVFISKAKQTVSPIFFADKHLSIRNRSHKIGGENMIDVIIDNKIKWFEGLIHKLDGPFQRANIITGLYSVYLLSQMIKIDETKIATFFPTLAESTRYIGRWQVLSKSPLTIADSAHNEGGLQIVLDKLKTFSTPKFHIVLGFVNDKDVTNILSLFPKDATYYFAKANIPRGLDANALQESAANVGLYGNSYRSVKEAFSAAKRSAKSDEVIYIGGSIFVVAEVI